MSALVLASGSPRRHHLLTMLGVPHDVSPVAVDESRMPKEPPETYARRLARTKALAGARAHPGRWTLGADTIVVLDDDVLGKPSDTPEAESMLARLCGRQHQVITAIALAQDDRVIEDCDTTKVWLGAADGTTIKRYVATGEPMDKAGAYAAQGVGAALVERIEGDYFSVVGLPISRVSRLFRELGLDYILTR